MDVDTYFHDKCFLCEVPMYRPKTKLWYFPQLSGRTVSGEAKKDKNLDKGIESVLWINHTV